MRNKLSRALVLFCLPIFLAGSTGFFSQSKGEPTLPPLCKAYNRSADSLILDSLKVAFGQNKILPEGYELPALRALSHYPELRNVPVAFVFKKAKIAHTSRPVWASMFRKQKKRRYLIIISTSPPAQRQAGMLKNLNYNSQIGVLGHELAHTVYYLNRGLAPLTWLGLKYTFSKKSVRKWENATDSTAILHNLGYQLHAWSSSVHALLEADGRGGNYYSPEKILEIMRNISQSED